MVYMLLGTGFEETEAIAPLDLLRRAGVDIQTVGINGKIVYGSHGIGIEADIELGQMDLTSMEMIILPGGLGGVASARASKEALDAHLTLVKRLKKAAHSEVTKQMADFKEYMEKYSNMTYADYQKMKREPKQNKK